MSDINKISILVVLFFISFSIFGQKNFFFITNVKGINDKIDSIPYFIYEKPELDSFLLNNQIIPAQEEIWGINVYVYASFFVDTLGNPYQIKILKVDVKINELTELNNYDYLDTMKVYYSKESARLITLTEGMWHSNSYNCKNKINIIIPFRTEAFENKNRKALKPDRDHRPGEIYYDYSSQGEIKTSKNIYKYYDFGVGKLNQNKLIIAQKYFEQALLVKKNDVDALYNLGVCFYKENKKDKACDNWILAWKLGDSGAQELLERYCK